MHRIYNFPLLKILLALTGPKSRTSCDRPNLEPAWVSPGPRLTAALTEALPNVSELRPLLSSPGSLDQFSPFQTAQDEGGGVQVGSRVCLCQGCCLLVLENSGAVSRWSQILTALRTNQEVT